MYRSFSHLRNPEKFTVTMSPISNQLNGQILILPASNETSQYVMVNTHGDINLIKDFEAKGHKVIDLKDIDMYLDGSHRFKDIKPYELPEYEDKTKKYDEDNASKPIEKEDEQKIEDLFSKEQIESIKKYK